MSTKQTFSLPIVKRIAIAEILGLGAGLLCISFVAKEMPEIWDLKNPLFWTIVINRIVLGLVVGLAGFMTFHPIFKFRCFPFLRGAVFGAVVSLSMAFGGLIGNPHPETMMTIFWATIIAGVVYGMIIDIVATKFGGEGKALLEGCN